MRIIISVTNDIATDNRILKVAKSLHKSGFDITITGRKLKDSPEINLPYGIKRFKLLFNKGALFYAEYNLRLFIYLIFHKSDIFLSNDLDTLLANFLAAKLKKKKLIYDSHELFTEVPELVGRPKIQKIWKKIEKFALPRVDAAYTVCKSIADYYKNLYGIEMEVVRNIPICQENDCKDTKAGNIIYQGALNKGRGLENIIKAMQFIDNHLLVIAGTGDIENDLIQLVNELNLKRKVIFLGRVLPKELPKYTQTAVLGLSIEENMGLNYYYALPNKIFDYINNCVPVLCSPFPEMSNIIKKYNIGWLLKSREPKEIAKQINEILSNKDDYNVKLNNTRIARKELCWQNEEKNLLKIFEKI